MPGTHAAVGYFSLHNQGDAPLTIERISSPAFGKVQMHETVIRDGISSMQALPSVIIKPGASVQFAAGGKHLMLMQPAAATATGTNVTLEIHYDTDGLLIVSATMQSRSRAH
jgi:copper(I)-binding protein